MLRSVWLGKGREQEALDFGDGAIPPPIECSSGAEAGSLLADDPRITLLLVSDQVADGELSALADRLKNRSMPLEVLLLGMRSPLPAPLIPLFDRRDVTPWHVPAGFPLREAIEQAGLKAAALRTIFQVRQGLLARMGFDGTSEKARLLAERIGHAAAGDHPVLLSGPAGCGAGELARAIHTLCGRRAPGPLAIVPSGHLSGENGSALLFGESRGAAAGEGTSGLLHRSAGGTLVLLDVETVCGPAQIRLAETLASGRFFRTGSSIPEPCDSRIIATTSADLPKLAKAGKFRSDLLHRLAADPIAIPALADRREDIGVLATRFARNCWDDFQPAAPFPGFLPDALEALASTAWDRDRESLRHFVERYLLVAGLDSARPISAKDLEEDLAGWTDAVRERHPEPLELEPLRHARRLGLDHDRIYQEDMYSFMAIMKRRMSKADIAKLFAKSSRWVEITLNEIALWFLDRKLRTRADLQRDGILSRRFDYFERTRRGDGKE